MKNGSKCALGLVLILSACTTSRESLRANETIYTKTINHNYAELGKCIKAKLPMPHTTTNTVPIYVNGTFINTVTSETSGIEAYDDKEMKVFYINDFTKAGLNNFKHWIIEVRGIDNKNTKSEVQVKSKKTIWGKPYIAPDFLSEEIEKCAD